MSENVRNKGVFLSKAEIQEKVLKIVSGTLKHDIANISPDASFVEDLNADSLDQVELIMAFEAEFDCEIPQKEAEAIHSVAQVVEYIVNAQAVSSA